MLRSPLNSSHGEPEESPAGAAEEIAYEMAYGLSHELNNPLANIAGRARLLAEQESDPEKRQQLAIIVDQAMRGCEMIADLMLFARPPQWNQQTVDLCPVLRELHTRAAKAAIAQRLLVKLDIDPALGSATIQADSQAIVEALWAILRNAIEAARSQVCIELRRASDRLTIAIVDDGPGLSEEALAYAFHPYFSGREAGRGLGLGLSKARRIVALCGGSIALFNTAVLLNTVSAGCRASIEFPLKQPPQMQNS